MPIFKIPIRILHKSLGKIPEIIVSLKMAKMATPKDENSSEEDEVMARIRKRAEMGPSDDSEEDFSENDDEADDDELARVRRRAELVPSDDESDDGSSGDEDNVGRTCSLVEGSSDDGSEDDDSEEDAPPQSTSIAVRSKVQSSLSDDDDDSEEEDILEDSDVEDDVEDSDSDSDSDEADCDFRSDNRELSDIPLCERLSLKMYGGEGQTKKGASSKYPSHLKADFVPSYDSVPKAKKSKHAPMEQSSKWAVGRHREVVPVKKVRHRDPRFEELGSTPLSSKAAESAYSFLDDKRRNELSKLKTEIRKEKRKRKGREGGEDSKIEVMKSAEIRLKQVDNQRQQYRVDKNALSEWKEKEKKSVAAGKQPFYLKKKAAKELLLEARFDSMRKGKGGKKRVEKVMERKRKKTVAKERKFLPEERRNA